MILKTSSLSPIETNPWALCVNLYSTLGGISANTVRSISPSCSISFKCNVNNSYAEDTNTEQEKVEWCDLMIWQFPLWRFAAPAILKGWSDRIFRFFKNGGYYEQGTLRGKKAILSVTTGSGAETYTKEGFHGDMCGILKLINRGILECVGFSVLKPEINYSVAHLTDEGRKMVIEKWGHKIREYFFRKRNICQEILKSGRIANY